MKKIFLLFSAILAIVSGANGQNPIITAKLEAANPARNFVPASNNNNLVVLTSDTLLYFFNKHFFRNPNTPPPAPNLQFWTIKSPLAPGNPDVTHCGVIFLNTNSIMVHGLEGLVMRSPSSTSSSVGIALYLCNVNGLNLPIMPPLDSVLTTVSTSTAGVWVGGNFTNAVNVTSKFAVLFKVRGNVPTDTAVVFMNNAATPTSTAPTAQKFGESLGVLRYNGNFLSNTNLFGTGTDYEFIVAPRVSFNYNALASTITPSICTNSIGTFSGTNSVPALVDHRQFNFNKFAPYWAPTNTLMAQIAPDSIYNWTFTGAAPATANVKNPSVLFNTPGIQTASLNVKYRHSANQGYALTFVVDGITTTINVTASSAPSIAVTGNTALCSGSSTTLTANGNPTYTWTNPSSNSSSVVVTPGTSTTYTVMAGSGNCVAVQTVMVNVATNPTVTITGNNSGCVGGGPVSLNGAGASSYTWNTGSNSPGIAVSTTLAGIFGFTLTGENFPCASATAIKNVTIFATPLVILSSPSPSLCSKASGGNSVTLTGGPPGGNFFGSGLSPGGIFTPNSVGTFPITYIYTDPSTGCAGNASINITVIQQTVSLSPSQLIGCTKITGGSNIPLNPAPSGQGGAYTGVGVNQSTGVFSPNTVGTIVISYTYTNPTTGCTRSTSTSIQISDCTGLEKNTSGPEISLYPNPSIKGIIYAKNLEGNCQISIYNLLGACVAKCISDKTECVIDLSNQPDGHYFIKISNNSGLHKTLKIVNQNQ